MRETRSPEYSYLSIGAVLYGITFLRLVSAAILYVCNKTSLLWSVYFTELSDETGTWTSISKEQDFLSAYDLQSVYGEIIDSIFARCGGCYESDIAGGV